MIFTIAVRAVTSWAQEVSTVGGYIIEAANEMGKSV
jgi:hypothetical protein